MKRLKMHNMKLENALTNNADNKLVCSAIDANK